MAKENPKLGKDIERLNQRILESKRILHETEIKAEDLDTALQAAKQTKENIKQSGKSR
jgi:hypothetical protein